MYYMHYSLLMECMWYISVDYIIVQFIRMCVLCAFEFEWPRLVSLLSLSSSLTLPISQHRLQHHRHHPSCKAQPFKPG